jgi:hypothetical protein
MGVVRSQPYKQHPRRFRTSSERGHLRSHEDIPPMSTKAPKDTEIPPAAPEASGNEESISEADAAAIAAAMAEEEAGSAAKSLKCTDCGKLFKNADLANYHAEKSGHENFEESVEEVPNPRLFL